MLRGIAWAGAALITASAIMMGQVPQGATGQCKDGSYTTSPIRSIACRGHEGVHSWFAGGVVQGPAADTPKNTSPSETGAAETGRTRVWLNTATKVYHCPGTRYYGKTRQGTYMTEAAARADGAHADHNHACGK